MNKNISFSEIRTRLLSDILQQEDEKVITEDFKRDFFKLIELCTFSMMEEGDNFFALFTIQMEREINLELPTAVGNSASLSHFIIYFNPRILLECSIEEMKALIKHEVYHIMYNHKRRADALKGQFSRIAINRAMDVSINQYIRNLPAWCDTLKSVSLTYNIDLKPELPMEEYARIIQEGIDKLKRKKCEKIITTSHDPEHAHDIWYKSKEAVDLDSIKELTKKVVDSSSKGKIPSEFIQIIKELRTGSQISWKDYLKKFVGTVSYGHKKTTTRRNRRQPERMDLRGVLSNHVLEIVIAIDISGSMSDEEIDQVMTEVFYIVRNHNTEITVVECDNEIRRVYKVKDKKDIKSKLNTRGSTTFSPVFEYIRRHRMRNHLLIYFTDGVGEEELKITPINRKTLWILTGKGEKLSLKNPYGYVKKLSDIDSQSRDLSYAKDAMKEILMEWAK